MSLYYELDPADDNDPPLLPPILTPVAVPDKIEVFNKAIAAAANSAFASSTLDTSHLEISPLNAVAVNMPPI